MNRILFPLLVIFITAGLVGGFLIVGGPDFARKERHDEQRANDLRKLARYYRCQPEVRDPVTGKPYDFALIDDDTFEICAEFETDYQHRRARDLAGMFIWHFEGRRGCVRHSRYLSQVN